MTTLTSKIFTSLARRHAVSDKRSETEMFVTTTQVVQVAPTRLDVCKIADHPGKPWLTLELLFGVEHGATGYLQTGELVLTRDGARAVLGQFKPAELEKGKVQFATARDQLLAEVLPTAAKGPGSGPIVRRSWFRRVTAKLLPWLGGAVSVIVLALVFNPARNNGNKGVALTDLPRTAEMPLAARGQTPPLTADELSKMLPASQAPAAWSALPDEQKRILMEAAERVAAGTGNDMSADVAKLVANLTQASPVTSAGPNGAAPRTNPVLSAEDFKRVAAAPQIRTSTGGSVFYGFVDPMCSACQHMESQVLQLDKKLNFVAIPVGFQGGGRDQAAAAFCARDKVDAWHKAAQVQPVGTKPCDEGYKQVDANNKLFLSLGFTKTPTMIAPNARIAVGSAESDQLAAWVTTNLK